jgi:hypothetical protein
MDKKTLSFLEDDFTAWILWVKVWFVHLKVERDTVSRVRYLTALNALCCLHRSPYPVSHLLGVLCRYFIPAMLSKYRQSQGHIAAKAMSSEQ